MAMLDLVLILAALGSWLMASLVALRDVPDDRPYVALGGLGALLSLGVAVHVLVSGAPAVLNFSLWSLPARLEMDALSAAFTLPLAIVAGLGMAYGREYWPLTAPKGAGRYVRTFFSLLAASLLLVLTARQGVLFLLAWEGMALTAFFLMAADHEKSEVQRASWIYLMCTHTGTLILFAVIALLFYRSGSFLWLPLASLPSSALDGVILALALVGFGFKAGFLPLHFWLPDAHAAAPSHVSAILSGVMLKMGIYGMLRITSLMPHTPVLMGELVLALGVITALYGVINSLAQSDYKRLLAYSSIENIGIIGMGLGLGWTGRACHSPWIAALGFAGAIFHVWNHSIFKCLLFFGAGSLLHATGTRKIEALGGLGARMPRTALVVFPGILAVAALPPFNAFLSEWFLYRGLFASFSQGSPWLASLALPALALTGGFAALAFAKFYGFVFLGEPRTPAAEHAHDPSAWMLAPMGILAVLCLGLGLGSALLLPALDRVIGVLAPEAVGLLAPGLRWDLTLLSGMMGLLLLLAGAGVRWLSRGRKTEAPAPRPPTWDCGYAQPTARMQYTGSSFSDGWAALMPGVKAPVRRIRALFPRGTSFRVSLQDALGDGQIIPRLANLAERLRRFRQLQQGYLSVYLLYILLSLLGVFLWLLLRPRLLG
jgi:hydrogenase-4 component B